MDSNINLNSTIVLSNGSKMPIIGIGTCLITDPKEVATTLTTALEAGCRLIDTAYGYMNQHLVGAILKKQIDSGKVKREDLFIVDKLPNNGMRPDKVEHFFEKSSEALQVKYIDLYLIHSPISTKHTDDEVLFPSEGGVPCNSKDDVVLVDDEFDLLETWRAVEKLVKSGKVRSIGLCNFNSEQVQHICEKAKIKPSILEVECHVYLPQYKMLQEVCNKLEIKLMANCPLGIPDFPLISLQQMNLDFTDAPDLLKEKNVIALANKYEKSHAQILLRYLVQRGIVPIAQSVEAERIQEFMKIFDFTINETDMELLKSMETGYRYITLDYWKGMKDHKNYPFHIEF